MNRSDIPLILAELNLSEDCVTNIYNRGSWTYGTNRPDSDYDLIMVARINNQVRIRFTCELNYFHRFDLHKLWNRYDIVIYSIENFKILLEKNYLDSVQCLFLPDEFKIKEDIDFQKIYLEKYYNPSKLKLAAFYEMLTDLNYYFHETSPIGFHRSSNHRKIKAYRQYYIFKNLFHGIRYLDFAEQLIQTQSIHDFKRVTPIFFQMKDICGGDPAVSKNMKQVVELVCEKSAELKSRLNLLIPTNNIVKGTFKVYITFCIKSTSEQTIEQLKEMCVNRNYRIRYLQLYSKEENDRVTELIALADYDGEYPSIVKQVEEEIQENLFNFPMTRIQIMSAVSNEGVPQTDIEKQLCWNDKTNYFRFQYKLLSDVSDCKEDDHEKKDYEVDNRKELLEELEGLCKGNQALKLYLYWSRFNGTKKKKVHYLIAGDLFYVGKKEATEIDVNVLKYLSTKYAMVLYTKYEFVVYDRYIDVDKNPSIVN